MHQSCAARRYVARIESAARLYLALFAVFIVLVKAVKLAVQAKEAQEFSRVPGILHKCHHDHRVLKDCRVHLRGSEDQVHCLQEGNAMPSRRTLGAVE